MSRQQPVVADTYLVVVFNDGSSGRFDPSETERLEALFSEFVCGRIGDRLIELTSIYGSRTWMRLSDMTHFLVSTSQQRRRIAAQQWADQQEQQSFAEEFGLNSEPEEPWK